MSVQLSNRGGIGGKTVDQYLLDLFDLLLDLRGRSCRAEAVAAFLAILELARLDLVRLHRTRSGEILLYGTSKELQAHELEAIQG